MYIFRLYSISYLDESDGLSPIGRDRIGSRGL